MPKHVGQKVLEYGLLLFAGVVMVLLLVPARSGVRPQGRLNGCINHMQSIAQAIVAYSEDHGELPPPFLADDQGNPAHSWRVLILPYLEETYLYEAYNFDESWDSPSNLALPTPSVYRCPSDSGAMGDTGYVAVVGDTTPWPVHGHRKMKEVSDSDILVIETFDARQHWLDPNCPSFQSFIDGDIGLSSEHKQRGVVVAVFGDAKYQYLDFDFDKKRLAQMLTIDSTTAIPTR